MITLQDYIDNFKMDVLPIAKNDVSWNGKPFQWSNIPDYNLVFSQKFGVNAYIYKQFKMKGHNGLDIAGSEMSHLVFPCKVWTSDVVKVDKGGYGTYVRCETETITLNGNKIKLELIFGHLREIWVDSGHWYQKGFEMGYMGNTGFSTGTHLHLGLRPWISKDGNTWECFADYDNGFFGYIDPAPFFPHIVWDKSELSLPNNENNLNKFMETNEKKLVIEGENTGRVGIIIDGKLREIKKTRKADACIYILANNGLGKTVNTDFFETLPKDIDF